MTIEVLYRRFDGSLGYDTYRPICTLTQTLVNSCIAHSHLLGGDILRVQLVGEGTRAPLYPSKDE